MNPESDHYSRAIQQRAARRREARRRRQRKVALIKALLLLCLIAGLIFLASRLFGNGEEQPSPSPPPAHTAMAELEKPSGEKAEPTAEEMRLHIQENPRDYPEAMLELIEKYAQTIEYVYHYPEYKDKEWEIDLSAEAAADAVPLLMQWDSRWGYAPYGSGLVGYTGCGPTSLSMVALYLLDDSKWTPLEVAKFAEKNGYCSPGNGSKWTLMSEGSAALGLSARELPLVERYMKDELDLDHPIIMAMGPGDFTTGGHFIVVTGYDEEGFIVNDPNSRTNSEKRWSFQTLQNQIKNLWAMSKA